VQTLLAQVPDGGRVVPGVGPVEVENIAAYAAQKGNPDLAVRAFSSSRGQSVIKDIVNTQKVANAPKMANNMGAENEQVKQHLLGSVKRMDTNAFANLAIERGCSHQSVDALRKYESSDQKQYLLLRQQLLQDIHTSLEYQIDTLTKEGLSLNPALSSVDQVVVNQPLVNYGDAVCACAQKLKSFEDMHCTEVLQKSGNSNGMACLQMLRELNRKSPDCICPIDPSAYGACGVPLNFDLYGNNKVNGFALPLPALPASHASRRLLQHADSDGVAVTGLDNHPDTFAAWVRNTTAKAHKAKNGDSLIWEDVIPEQHGRYIRENCANMVWSVKHEALGVSMDFKGLSFEVNDGSDRRRRRLLGRSQNSGC
jgi:hypothetical protein